MDEIPIDWCNKSKKQNEASLYPKIQKAAEKLGHKLFRNQVGSYKIGGRYITYGLGVGSSDGVGWRSIIITPDMVGMKLAQFLAAEVKLPGKKPTEMQQKFIDRVNEAGGIAGVVTSVDELLELLNGKKI